MRLLICYTPLHALIFQSVNEKDLFTGYYALYICFLDNEKNRCCYEKLLEGAVDGEYLVLNHRIANDFIVLMKWWWGIRGKYRFQNVTTGNLKHFYSRYIAWLFNVDKYQTFDDGCGNIAEEGYFYRLEENRVSSLFFRAVSPRYLYKNSIECISAHYSIYEGDNVYKGKANKFVQVDVFPKADELEGGGGSVNVLLGVSFFEHGLLSEDQENAIEMAALRKYNVDVYLPHPRRKNFEAVASQGIVVLSDKRIAEEIVYDLGRQYKEVRVFGFYSSVLFNLAGLDFVDLINIDVDIPGLSFGNLGKLLRDRAISTEKLLF